MSWAALILIWAFGALVALAVQVRLLGYSLLDTITGRQAAQLIGIALLWPLVVAAALATLLVDTACFLIAVAKKPH